MNQEEMYIEYTKRWAGHHGDNILWRTKDKISYFWESPTSVRILFIHHGEVDSMKLTDEYLKKYFPERCQE